MHTEESIFSDIYIEKENIRQPVYDIRFHGRGGEYFKIWIVNLFLTIVTLGIYSAWATVRKRRYFYGNTEIDNSHFDYHALPVNLLLSRIVVAVFICLYVIASLIHPILQLICLLILCLLAPYFILRSWRFNAVMTSFRNIRFNYHCHFGRGYLAILLLPLGLLVVLVACVIAAGAAVTIARLAYNDPYFDTPAVTQGMIQLGVIVLGIFFILSVQAKSVYELLFNHLAFGRKTFSVQLSYKKFIKIYGISMLMFLPFMYFGGIVLFRLMTMVMLYNYYHAYIIQSVFIVNMISMYLIFSFGIMVSSAFIRVAVLRYVLANVALGEMLKFRSSISFSSYFLLIITNSLITIFTAGLGMPLAQIRHARYMAEHTRVVGDISLTTIRAHDETKGSAVEDELVDSFDIGITL